MSLILRNINKSYGETRVLEDITFDVKKGELMVILGPSGAGKSKTLEIVAGIEEADSGEVFINNVDVSKTPPRKRNIGFVFQDYSLFPHKNVYENISFGLNVRGEPDVRERVVEIAKEMKVDDLLERYPDQISGGEQQRVALARALVTRPEILLFDEPLSSLDQRVREELRKSLKNIQRKHKVTTLYVTHDYVEAIALAHKIAVLKKGSVLQYGTPEEIFYRPVSREVAEFTGTTNIFDGEAVESSGKLSKVTLNGIEISVNRQLPVGPVTICIRPESIMFIRPDRPSSFQNVYSGKIDELESFGSAMQRVGVVVEGMNFFVNVPNHVAEKMELKGGKDVRISLKDEKIHFLPAAERIDESSENV